MIIRKGNTEEIYHGVSVPDPYRWLEDENLNETKEWTAYQNNGTRRNEIKKKLTQLMNYPKYSPPQRKGDYYYFFNNDGLQNQPILYRTMDIHERTNLETVIDLNQSIRTERQR
ncbi:hypothetical protein KM914_20195 [Virgibacillus pantothenticus]|uniref:hypothetical protein n=1 Tax=Virgibacillus TaxID=84406 RepID=UPI00067E2AA0|nr:MULTISPECIES: hypothetical protein [Virgibacillus]API90911.1 hypothetical protein BKP57_03000 [Virgibacillus sp. 6R]MBS7428884.1 hypothetical protein [Virgibacillus sp. 19R1-5]MBU8568698.1 hypothetical protein [Virgibacillus pantothenticus]MBU8602699.1 hypothetical protein [Virgibacillus pantothenticus]MBU8636820.1 hypothetical protein [Virgibacillus pantothenticus]